MVGCAHVPMVYIGPAAYRKQIGNLEHLLYEITRPGDGRFLLPRAKALLVPSRPVPVFNRPMNSSPRGFFSGRSDGDCAERRERRHAPQSH
jgi:hypothetical protein